MPDFSEADEGHRDGEDATRDANPRATIGGNNPPLARSIAAETGDFAQVVTQFLEDEYRQYPDQLNALMEAAAALPDPITCVEDKEATATIIKQFRDLAKKLEAFHTKEKQPYLRGGQGVDQYFFGLIDRIAKRNVKARPGAADTLLGNITDYDRRVLAEEQARRIRVAQEAAEAARIAREAQEAAAREAARVAAAAAAEAARVARARTDATRAARQAEQAAADAAARHAADTAAAARAATEVATAAAQEAHIDTLARAPDLMRNRGQDGTMTTMAQKPFAEVHDRSQLNMALLWPFLPIDAIEKALKAWAKTTDYNVQMDGATIGRRAQSVVR